MIGDVLDLAAEVGAGDLVLFHHAPTRTDDELADLVARARNDLLAEGRTFGLRAAREGEALVVGERGSRTDGAGDGD